MIAPQKHMLLLLIMLMFGSTVKSQFAPPAGQTGSSAVHVDSNIILKWATSAEIERGLMRIDNPQAGVASFGLPENALGKADLEVVSLGDGGHATLGFEVPLWDGPGADFVIFENSFDDTFLELAHVEASSDGQNFVRFPSISLTSSITQIGTFGTSDATLIHNLAGKYRALYGVPFDLEELKFDQTIDVDHVTHIRIVDVIGSVNISFGSFDGNGNIINDPFPTPFPSGGFDLDAVGVIHDQTNQYLDVVAAASIDIFPNPFEDILFIQAHATNIHWEMKVFDMNGRLMIQLDEDDRSSQISTAAFPSGCYVCQIISENKYWNYKLIKF